jgi:hypothetical protein
MSQGIVFAERYPHCNREQAQEGYTVGELMKLLSGPHPIEAYCAYCDEFWTVSAQKRVELGEIVAAAGITALPQERQTGDINGG